MNEISLIPKKDKGLPSFSTFQKPKLEFNALTKVGLVLLALAVMAWVGLYLWQVNLNKQIQSYSQEKQQLTGQRNLELENKLKNLGVLLEVFNGILTNHRRWSKFFILLQQKTVSSIIFNTFKGDDKTASIVLEGSSASYGALAQQIKVLENTAGVAGVAAPNIGLSEEGRVKFNIKLNFISDLIK